MVGQKTLRREILSMLGRIRGDGNDYLRWW